MKRLLLLFVLLISSFSTFAYCLANGEGDCDWQRRDIESLGTWEEQLEGLRVNMMIDPRTRGRKLTIGDKEYSCVVNSDDSIDCYER